MKPKHKINVRSVIAHIVLILLSFLCLFFFVILIINATRSHAQLQKGFSFIPGGHFLDNLKSVANDGSFPMFRGIVNSLIISGSCAVLCTYFSSLTAYGLYAYDFKLKKAAFTFIMAILVMPTQVTAMGFLRLITNMGMYDSWTPLIIPSIASPAVFYFMYSYLQSSLPLSLVEAARIDGSNEFRTFNHIVLPIMKPAIAVQAIFTFVGSWNNYFTPALIIQSKGFSFIPGGHFLDNLKSVANDGSFPMFRGIVNSLIISGSCAVLCTYFSSLTAYGLYAYDFKLKKAAFTFIMAILVMPTQVTAMGFLRLITNMGMYDSWTPLIIPSIASPAVFYFMYSYLQSSLPLSLVEAARIDGSNEFRTFNHIVLPIMKPAIAVQAIFTFVGSWNNYFTPALIIQSKNKMTVPILIATLRGADYMNFDMGKIYMMITVAIVPIIVVYLLLSKYIIAGVTLGGVKE